MKKNQTILKLKNTITTLKNAIENFNNQLDQAMLFIKIFFHLENGSEYYLSC